MTKNEFIIQAVLSLNKGDNNSSYERRVSMAVKQYEQLLYEDIEFEEEI